MKAKKLTKDQLNAVLQRINQPEPKQAARICIHLADHPKSPTVKVNLTCSIGNISDFVFLYFAELRNINLMAYIMPFLTNFTIAEIR